jgi:hypothetical protein
VLESVKQARAGFRSPKDAWADTTTPYGQLIGLAEFEHTLIRARTGEAANGPRYQACVSGARKS